MKRGDTCPKCAEGKLSGLRYVASAARYDPCDLGSFRLTQPHVEPEHLLLTCNQCGYGHKMPTADQASKGNEALREIMRRHGID